MVDISRDAGHDVRQDDRVREGNSMGSESAGREILYELRQVGNVVKVTAIDVATNTEVSTMGPVAAGEHGLKAAALRKLDYVLAQRGQTPR